MPWTATAFDDKDWPTTQVVRDTWSTLGHHNTVTDMSAGRSGRMAYRTTVNLSAVPAGKKVYLWIGSTDGSAKLYINGQSINYIVPGAGDVRDTFTGFCDPAQFEITAAVKPGANQITILCERKWLNELGTGGLMGPVAVYRER